MFARLIPIFGRLVVPLSKARIPSSVGTGLGAFFKSNKNTLKGKISTSAAGKFSSAVGSMSGKIKSWVASTRIGKAYLSSTWAQDWVKTGGQLLLVDGLINLTGNTSVDSDKGTIGGKSTFEIIASIMTLNGHSELSSKLRNNSGSNSIANSTWTKMGELVKTLFHDKSLMASGSVSLIKDSQLDGLSDKERLGLVTQLVAIIKTVSVSSEYQSLMLAYARQAMISDILNSSPTEAFYTILDGSNALKEESNEIAAHLSLLMSNHVDGTSSEAAKDVFSKKTSISGSAADTFDISQQPGTDSAWTPYLTTQLATDDSVAVGLSALQELTVGSDDDEFYVKQRLQGLVKVADKYSDAVLSLISASGDYNSVLNR